jgi:hypothetical protein
MPKTYRKTIQKFCQQCGNAFDAPIKEERRGKGYKYCSRKCFFDSREIPLGRQFLNGVDKPERNGCILWRGTLRKDGYGVIFKSRRQGKQRLVLAHRFAWEITYGTIPSNLQVLHRCDTPGCVNPSHLFLGTMSENMKDKASKGRHFFGSNHNFAKLTESDIAAIRLAYKNGISQMKLARQYGVCVGNISMIVRRLSWKHVT